jgi:ferredoxin
MVATGEHVMPDAQGLGLSSRCRVLWEIIAEDSDACIRCGRSAAPCPSEPSEQRNVDDWLVSTPEEERLVDAAVATSLGDTVLPDPEEVWLSRFRDATLLVLAVVAHAHGASAKQVRRATGQFPGAVWLSLRHLERAGLVEQEHVTRLLGAIKPLYSGWWGDWSVKNNPWRLWPLRIIDASRARTVATHHNQG